MVFGAMILIWINSCNKENAPYVTQPTNEIHLQIAVNHIIMGDPLNFDTLLYKTSTGNQYMVSDLQYFISGIRLHLKDRKWIYVNQDKDIHYVDARNEKTFKWNLPVADGLTDVDSVSFVFGLDEDNNISGRFPDPPERDMFWPEMLGGEYHYMKMNLKWKKPGETETRPFMFHLGIGQMYQGTTTNPDSIIGFIQNYFVVSSPFFFKNPDTKDLSMIINMNIERWFDGKYEFVFADYPNGIMQDQEGMFKAAQNGRKVFDIKVK